MAHLRKSKRGFTLTELAIVLSIIGLILGAIWAAASKVYANQKTAKAVQEIITIAHGVKSLYANKGVVDGGDLTPFGVTGGLFPSDMVQQAACSSFSPYTVDPTQSPCAITPFNTVATVGGPGAWICPNGSCTTNTFNIAFWNLTQDQCVPLLASLVPQAAQAGLVGLFSDSGGATAISTTTSISSAPIATCAGNVILEFKL